MINGNCHCGAVQWSYSGLPVSATSCNCTLCRRWGALWAYGFKNEEIAVSGPTSAYIHGPKTIEFHFCARCGCVTYWQTPGPGQDGRYYMAVNLRLAEPDAVADIEVKRFDGFESFEALEGSDRCIADIWF